MKNPFSRLFYRNRRKEYKAMQNRSDMTWYQDEIRKMEHMQRINMVSDIDSYLLREHKVLQRPNFQFKDKEFQTAKIILQTVKTIINFHTSYTVGNPISFTGDKELVELIERVYRKGQFTKQDYEITTQLMKYGNAWEYIYLQDNKIKSKVFINDECYPCYDDKGNYYAFIEYWRDKDSGVTCPRQHRHLKRKDSIRFLVLLVFSNFYIYTGCRKGTRSRQPHPRKDLFKSS